MTDETPAFEADVKAQAPDATTQQDSEQQAEEPKQTEAEIKLAKALEREKREKRKERAINRQTQKALEELRSEVGNIKGQRKEDSAPKKPNRSDYDDYEKYFDDLEAWVEHSVKAKDEPKVKTSKDAYREKRIKALDKSGETARQKYNDFDEVLEEAKVGNALPLEGWVWDELFEYDASGEILYMLAKDEDLEDLNGLSRRALQRKLDRLEASLEETEKPKTKAPAPMKAAKGTGSAKREKTAAEYLAEAMKL